MTFKESRNLELKSKYTKTCLKTIAAFATYGTGEIIFGVSDIDGKVEGLSDVEQTKLSIESGVRDTIKPLPNYNLEEIDHEGKSLVKMTVLRGENYPYFYKNKVYKRFDTSTATVDQTEIRRLIMQNEQISFEDLDSHMKSSEFQFDVLERLLREHRENFEKLKDNTLKTLELINENGKYNRAAEVLSDKPSNNYASLDMVRFGETMSIFIERRLIEKKSLLDQYLIGLDMFDKWYSTYEEVSGFYRVERVPIPREAFREALANALIHQDMSINSAVKVVMREDYIEITSPGGLPTGLTKEMYLSGDLSIPRNHVIANVFRNLGIIERFGTGINRIRFEYEEFKERPEFTIGKSHVKIKLPIIKYDKKVSKSKLYGEIKLSEIEEKIISVLSMKPTVSQRELAKEVGIARSTTQNYLKDLIERNIIVKAGTSTRDTKYIVNIQDYKD